MSSGIVDHAHILVSVQVDFMGKTAVGDPRPAGRRVDADLLVAADSADVQIAQDVPVAVSSIVSRRRSSKDSLFAPSPFTRTVRSRSVGYMRLVSTANPSLANTSMEELSTRMRTRTSPPSRNRGALYAPGNRG